VPKDTHRAATADPAQLELWEQVTLTLGEVADATRERLLALAVGTGLQVLQAMLAEDVARLVGSRATIPTALPCGRPNQPAITRALFIKEKTASVTSPAS
jgi:hypothetical protein